MIKDIDGNKVASFSNTQCYIIILVYLPQICVLLLKFYNSNIDAISIKTTLMSFSYFNPKPAMA